ncbi:hypothetical protein, partial [Mycolicibacterium sphagni]
PQIQRGLVDPVDTRRVSDVTAAAAAIRGEAAAIEDPTLRSTTVRLADNLERVSNGNPSSPPNGFPGSSPGKWCSAA